MDDDSEAGYRPLPLSPIISKANMMTNRGRPLPFGPMLIGSLLLLLMGACADEPIQLTSNACTGNAPMVDESAADDMTVNSDDDNSDVDNAIDEDVGETTDAGEQQALCDQEGFAH